MEAIMKQHPHQHIHPFVGNPDPVRPPSRFDAGSGQGTVTGNPFKGMKYQEHPLLDGSTMSHEAEALVVNPHRGEESPARELKQEALTTASTTRYLMSGIVAAILITVALLFLLQWEPVLSGIGILVVLFGLFAMLIVRGTHRSRPTRLRIEASILTVMWVAPITLGIIALVRSLDEILAVLQ